MWDLGTDGKWNMTVFVSKRHKQKEEWLCMQSHFSSKSSQKHKYSFFPIWSLIYRPPGWDSFWNQHLTNQQNLIAFISTHCNFVPVSMCSNCSNFSPILGSVRLFSLYDKQLISCDWKMHIMTATVKSGSASVTFLQLGIVIAFIFFTVLLQYYFSTVLLNIFLIVLHCLLYLIGDFEHLSTFSLPVFPVSFFSCLLFSASSLQWLWIRETNKRQVCTCILVSCVIHVQEVHRRNDVPQHHWVGTGLGQEENWLQALSRCIYVKWFGSH